MHRIAISSGTCGKLVSTKWGVQELEVDNIQGVPKPMSDCPGKVEI